MAQSLLPPIPSLLLFYFIKDSGPIRGALTMPIHRLASSSHIFFVDSLNFCHCRNTFLSHKLGSHIRSTAWMSVRRVPEPQETARLHTNKYTPGCALKQELPETLLGYLRGNPEATGENGVYRWGIWPQVCPQGFSCTASRMQRACTNASCCRSGIAYSKGKIFATPGIVKWCIVFQCCTARSPSNVVWQPVLTITNMKTGILLKWKTFSSMYLS